MVWVTCRHHADGQSLIVEPVARAHLQLQFCGLTWHDAHAHTAGGQCLSVHTQFSTVGVSLVGREQRKDTQSAGGGRLLALVANEYREAGRVVHRHAAYAMLVEADGRVVNLQRTLVEDRASLIEVRLALILPRVAGVAATGAEHEAARSTVVGYIGFSLQIIQCLVGDIVEVVVGEHIFHVILATASDISHRHAIDIHAQAARRRSGNGKRCRAVELLRLAVGANGRRGQHGCQRPTEVFAFKFERRFLIFHSTTSNRRIEFLKRL